MKHVVLPLVALLAIGLSACVSGSVENIEPASMDKNRSVLDLLKGPNVNSMEKTLLDNARAAEAEGNMPRAVTFYQQLRDRAPENRDFTLALSQALRKNSSCNDALQLYESMLKKDPKDIDALEGKGMCLMAINEGKEAGQIFTQVLELDPNRWRTLNSVGVLFAGKGKVPEATAYFEKAASIDSSQISVINNLGLAYLLDKRYDQAIETFARAQKRLPSKSPDKARIDMNLALAYALMGDMDNAQKFAKPHVSEAGLYNNLGFFAKLSKDDQLARDYLNMALSKSSTFYKKAWDNLGTMSRSPGDHTTNDYGVKVQKDPNAPAPRKITPPPATAAKAVVKPVVKPAAKAEPEKPAAAPVAAPEESAEPRAAIVDMSTMETVKADDKPDAKSEEAAPKIGDPKFKSLSPRSDIMLDAPPATSLERIEPAEENRLLPNDESRLQ